MATMYELTGEYAALMERLDTAEDDAEINEIWAALEGLEGDISEKADAYARILRNKQAEADALKAEKKRLADKQSAAENAVERLKARMLESMKMLGVEKIETAIGKWAIRENPWSCEVVDETQVPEAYRVPQPDKIDRAAMLKDFKASGEMIPGVEFKREIGIRLA